MRIRTATLDDRQALARMGRHFLEHTPYGTLLPATAKSLDWLVDFVVAQGDNSLILVAEDDDGLFGMLALLRAKHPLTGDDYADELCWWVEPHRRGGLRAGPLMLDAAEAWARICGLRMIKMVAPIPSEVGRFYERLGYRAIETAYVKTLTV